MVCLLTTALLALLLVVSQGGLASQQFNRLVAQAQDEHNAKKENVVLQNTGGQTLGIDWNRVLDWILEVAKKDIIRLGMDTVKLPSISEEFKNKVLFVHVSGVFTADEGTLYNLSTVRRTGDTQVKRNGTRLTVTCEVGLATLGFRYGHYRAKVHRVGSVSGHVTGTVGGANSVRLTAGVEVEPGGKCRASLGEVRVTALDGVKIRVSGSGFGPLNWLITKATNSYAKNHRQEIVEKIEQSLRTVLGNAMKDFDCQQYAVMLLL